MGSILRFNCRSQSQPRQRSTGQKKVSSDSKRRSKAWRRRIFSVRTRELSTVADVVGAVQKLVDDKPATAGAAE